MSRSMTSGKSLAVLGGQWGDEGKGKIVDLLAPHFDIAARYQGGHNAGHTVWVRGQKYVLHLLPSGILHPDVACVMGNGMVVDLTALFAELDMLAGRGVDVAGRLKISDRAHLILPYHVERDQAAEAGRGERKIGTTSRGIGPAYEDKIARRGIRVGDLARLDPKGKVVTQIQENIEASNRLTRCTNWQWWQVVERLREAWPRLQPFVADTSLYLHEQMAEGRSLLVEGAQGTHLDIDHGTFPFVTSSNPTVGGVFTGLGIDPKSMNAVLGVAKAYSTRVGEGPMVTELKDETGDILRQAGEEFGASTGRPRRCGWYDAVAVRYSARVNGLDALVITKLDVLDQLSELKICVKYTCEGQDVVHMPSDPDALARCRPVYKTLRGWCQPTGYIKRIEDLPMQAQLYLDALSHASEVPIWMVTNGTDRDSYIMCHEDNVPALDWLEQTLEHTTA